jgi:arginine exporter protein ArgO
MQVDATDAGPSRRAVVLTVLALTWLNPHVYLDTVLLLGSVANSHGGEGRWAFGVGAVIASALWFALLGFGARFLGPLFARRTAWRVLDAAIAVTMVALGIRLLLTAGAAPPCRAVPRASAPPCRAVPCLEHPPRRASPNDSPTTPVWSL